MSKTSKIGRYQRIADQLGELIAKTDHRTAHCATAVALLHHKMPGVSWTGFYFVNDSDLVVDAYQGPVACLVLEQHVGVCWAAIDRDQTLVVKNVHEFAGHIACDDRTLSEVVVPVHDADGRPIGVLDIDSHHQDHFDDVDGEGYSMIVKMLEEVWNTTASGA